MSMDRWCSDCESTCCKFNNRLYAAAGLLATVEELIVFDDLLSNQGKEEVTAKWLPYNLCNVNMDGMCRFWGRFIILYAPNWSERNKHYGILRDS